MTESGQEDNANCRVWTFGRLPFLENLNIPLVLPSLFEFMENIVFCSSSVCVVYAPREHPGTPWDPPRAPRGSSGSLPGLPRHTQGARDLPGSSCCCCCCCC